MWKRNKTVAAFTLMECLLSLMILSGGILVYDGLTKLISQEMHHQMTRQEKNWLVFAHQFRKELESVEFVKVEQDRLYVQKAGQQLAFGKSKSDDFRKTNDKGQGYQPMLYQLSTVEIREAGKEIRIEFRFENGMERTFLYAFKEAG